MVIIGNFISFFHRDNLHISVSCGKPKLDYTGKKNNRLNNRKFRKYHTEKGFF